MLIDITRLVTRRLKGRLPTGIDRVAMAYVERYAFGRFANPPTPVRPDHHPAQAVLRVGRWHGVLSASASRKVFEWLLSTPRTPTPWATLALTRPAATLRVEELAGRWLVNAGHSGLEDDRWCRGLRSGGARPLLVIHDLIPITHPQYCRAGEAGRHASRMRLALQCAHAIVANSGATLTNLRHWASTHALAMPESVAAHLGPGAGLTAAVGGRPAEAPAQPYFVCLGTIEPRKNHLLLLNVWSRLVEHHGVLSTPRLVLIGQRGWEVEHVGRTLDRSPALREVVIERPACSDSELARWLAHARALLFPSFTEGFGMPLVEALCEQVPVIASDLPVFREIAGDVVDYRDPLDGPAWSRIIEEYTQPDSPSRAAQLQRLRQFEAPSWSAHFEAVDRLLQKVDLQPGEHGPKGTPGRQRPAIRRHETVEPA